MTISRKDLKQRADNVHSQKKQSELDRIKERRAEVIAYIEQSCIVYASQGHYEFQYRLRDKREWRDLAKNQPESFKELNARFYKCDDPDYKEMFYFVHLTWK